MAIYLPPTTRALTLSSLGSPLAVLDNPLPPSPPSGTVILAVLAAPISPTSNGSLRVTAPHPFPRFPTPFVPGHSAIGRILAVGPDCIALQPGNLVFVEAHVTARDDPHGAQILLGLHEGYSARTQALFAHWRSSGSWQSVMIAPVENCHAIDEKALQESQRYCSDINKQGEEGVISPIDLAYLPRLAVAFGGCSAVGLLAGQTLILAPATGHYSGAVAEVASAMGARVIALSRNARILSRLSATVPRVATVVLKGDVQADLAAIKALLPPGSQGADAFLDITPGGPPMDGTELTHITSAFLALKPRGKVAIMGSPSVETLPIPYTVMMFKNITVKGQYMYTRDEVATTLRMVESGILKLGKEAGHDVVGRFKFEDWDEALKIAAAAGEWGKIVVFAP